MKWVNIIFGELLDFRFVDIFFVFYKLYWGNVYKFFVIVFK